MRKTLVLILFALLAVAAFGQGFETFANFPATGSSYSNGTFAGQDGSTWTYVQARGDYAITEKALMIGRNRTPQSECYSGTISGGIGVLNFDYMQAFGTSVNLNVLVNDVVVGNVTSAAQQSVVLASGAITVNIPGDFVLKFINVNNSDGQVVIDNIGWTAYSGAATPMIAISGALNPFTTFTGTPSESQSYTLSGVNLTAPISVTAAAGYALSTDQNTWQSSLSLPADFSAAVYVRLTGTTAGSYDGVINHTSTGADPVTIAVNGTVTDPSPMINLTGTLNPFSTLVGTPSASQNYSLTGLFLTESISVNIPAGFQISTDNSTWQASLSLPADFSGSIYVRLSGATLGSFSGEIIHSSFTTVEVLPISGEVTQPSGPTILLEENFNYDAGTLLTANGWTAHSGAGTNSPNIAVSGLLYPGYTPATGLAAQTLGNGEDVHRTFDTQGASTFYASFLFNASEANTTADYSVHLGASPIGTDFKGRFFIQKNAENQLRFGLTKALAAANAVWTDYVYALNQTYLVVMKYIVVPGPGNDEVYLWVNPTIQDTEPAAQLAAPDVTGTDANNIGSIAIRQGSFTPLARIDGIRVTNDWAMLFSGDQPDPPVLYLSGVFEPFAAYVNTPSEIMQSYQLWGENLASSINVQAPTGFELSADGSTGWATNLTLPPTFNGLVYVRLNADTVNEFRGNIVHTASGAETLYFEVEGETFYPDVTWNVVSNMQPFAATAGSPSAAQSYTLSANGAGYNLSLEVTGPFEISQQSTDGWASSLSLPSGFNAPVYVRFNAASVGTFPGTITHNTPGASEHSIALSGTTSPQAGMATDLFFSEYIEGGSNNKAIEIFNGTGGPVDLSDYRVELYSNGASTMGNNIVLSGILPHGEVYVIANEGSVASVLALADITSTVTYFNGDDALALRKLSTDSYVDIFGVIGSDPGTEWTAEGGYSTLNKTLVRKPNVTGGITVSPIGSTPPSPADFVTLGTEWDVYPQDTFSFLGYHVFSPGQDVAATPEITPAGGLVLNPVQINITASTPGSVIRYTTNGDDPDETSAIYSTPFTVSVTTTVKARAYADGYTPSGIAMAIYSFPVDVPNLAALRAGATDGTVYKLTGEAILTFQQGNRNQKYIQDATAAILIDDNSGNIVSVYNLYDGISGIIGTLTRYSNLLQFIPLEDPGIATSTGNVIIPEVRTLASLTPADQAKLIKVLNVTIDGTGDFGNTAQNFPVSDPSGVSVLRTFPNAEYAGSPVPQDAQDIVCLVGQFNTDMQISPRFLADMTLAVPGLEAPIVSLNANGNQIQVNWTAVAGAMSYRIEGANTPEGPFTELTTTTGQSWVGPAQAMKFFRVIAIQ